MDLQTLFRIVLRRWVVVLPLLLLTAVAGYQMVSAIEPEFQAEGSILLLSPSRLLDPEEAPESATGRNNPYIEFTGSLRTTATALQRIVTDSDHRRAIAEQGLSPSYSLSVDIDGPILNVTALAADRDVAIATVNGMLEMIEDELQLRQDEVGAPEDLRIGTQVLSLPSGARELTVARTRAVAALIALGIAAAFGGALLAESWASGRASPRRRSRKGAVVIQPGAQGVVSTPPVVSSHPASPIVPRPGAARRGESLNETLGGAVDSWARWNARRQSSTQAAAAAPVEASGDAPVERPDDDGRDPDGVARAAG